MKVILTLYIENVVFIFGINNQVIKFVGNKILIYKFIFFFTVEFYAENVNIKKKNK